MREFQQGRDNNIIFGRMWSLFQEELYSLPFMSKIRTTEKKNGSYCDFSTEIHRFLSVKNSLHSTIKNYHPVYNLAVFFFLFPSFLCLKKLIGSKYLCICTDLMFTLFQVGKYACLLNKFLCVNK
jgi:hypothetical protein